MDNAFLETAEVEKWSDFKYFHDHTFIKKNMSDVRIDHNESRMLILIKPLCLGPENSVRGADLLQIPQPLFSYFQREKKKFLMTDNVSQSSQHVDIKYLHKSFTH